MEYAGAAWQCILFCKKKSITCRTQLRRTQLRRTHLDEHVSDGHVLDKHVSTNASRRTRLHDEHVFDEHPSTNTYCRHLHFWKTHSRVKTLECELLGKRHAVQKPNPTLSRTDKNQPPRAPCSDKKTCPLVEKEHLCVLNNMPSC